MNELLALNETEQIEGHLLKTWLLILKNIPAILMISSMKSHTIIYDLYTAANNEIKEGREEVQSSSSRNRNEIPQKVEYLEMKKEFKSWIYKYTSVFDDELYDKLALKKSQ